jgi:hypothetical protein
MGLSCQCYTADDYDWYYQAPDDYSVLETKRARRCSSCRTLIPVGSTVAEFSRSRPPNCVYEEMRFGTDWEAVPLASYYLCERCADLYFSFKELGFECIAPDEHMRELAREYADTYGRNKEKELADNSVVNRSD